MQLFGLLKALPAFKVHGALPSGEVRGLVYDSRRAAPGMIFAALPGMHSDGHDFVSMAAEKGALAALVERVNPQLDICQVEAPDSREACALMAHEFYARPGHALNCIAVTGTNGKTTVTYMLEALLSQMGGVGVMGTVELRYGRVARPAAMTTPESVDLMAGLAEMRDAGMLSAVMEVSSHALEQRRAEGIPFEAAVFTNLSQDHLDYHGDMESYFEAKARLFTQILPKAAAAGKTGLAVLGWDDPKGRELARRCRELGLPAVSFGFSEGADVRGQGPEVGLEGGVCRVSYQDQEFEARTPLVGRFNLLNLLAAAAVGLGLGMSSQKVAQGLAACRGVPGRLERVGEGGPAVFVDYSHTPDALVNATGALKPLTKGRLICVFGAGGDRDPMKRPIMGRAVARGADLAVLTSDNPRTEDPLAIMAQVREGLLECGCRQAGRLNGDESGVFVSQPDRGKAIALAISQAGPQDVVLIAGKGHEDYQIIGTVKRHFDDREEARKALAARRNPHA